jgi:hypothetical protein
MRKWGAIIIVFYALIIAGLLVPVGTALLDKGRPHVQGAYTIYEQWQAWIPVGILLASQALLIFLSVDTSFKRLKPRAHILVTCILTGTLLTILAVAAILCLGFANYGDEFFDRVLRAFSMQPGSGQWVEFCLKLAASVGTIWLLWTIIFYVYVRNSNELITRATSWLLKGSVLELLIAVPCHVIIRRRNYCCAPYVTNFGIVCGIAIMLLSFGPSVLMLYKKRLHEYGERRSVME